MDQIFIDYIRELKEELSGKCQILLAADREETIVNMRKSVGDCEIYTTPKEEKASFTRDHGPFTGITAMADLYMLSYANHFVGTIDSTYSRLAAYLAWKKDGTEKFIGA